MKFRPFFRLTVGSTFAALCVASGAFAETWPNLPPDEIVARVLQANPGVQAAAGQIRVEEANRTRLEAGAYEWTVRLGGQQRRTNPATGPDELVRLSRDFNVMVEHSRLGERGGL